MWINQDPGKQVLSPASREQMGVIRSKRRQMLPQTRLPSAIPHLSTWEGRWEVMGGPDREGLPDREEAHLLRKTLAWGSQDPFFGGCISLPSLGFWKTGCEARLTGFESLSLSAVYPQKVTSPCLSFLIWKMGITVIPIWQCGWGVNGMMVEQGGLVLRFKSRTFPASK